MSVAVELEGPLKVKPHTVQGGRQAPMCNEASRYPCALARTRTCMAHLTCRAAWAQLARVNKHARCVESTHSQALVQRTVRVRHERAMMVLHALNVSLPHTKSHLNSPLIVQLTTSVQVAWSGCNPQTPTDYPPDHHHPPHTSFSRRVGPRPPPGSRACVGRMPGRSPRRRAQSRGGSRPPRSQRRPAAC